MSVKKYLDENTDKVEEKDTKVGKLKLNKKFVMGVAAVLFTATIAIGIVGCGNKKENPNPNPSQSGVVEQGQSQANQSPTPYYDSLYENNIYFKESKSNDPVDSFLIECKVTHGFELDEDGINILREELAKYSYMETTLRKVKSSVIDVLKNHTIVENQFNKVNYQFLTQYIDLLKKTNEADKDYSIDEKKLESVLEKFISKEYTEDKDLDKIKEVVGNNILLSELKNNNFGYNEKYDKFNFYVKYITWNITLPKYRTGYYGIENGQTVFKNDLNGYVQNKYGTEKLTLEQMNIDLKEIVSEDELDNAFKIKANGISYEQFLNDLFLKHVQSYYVGKDSYNAYEKYFRDYFTLTNGYYVYKNNSNIKLSEAEFLKLTEEWLLRIDETIIKSKLKYGEYTLEGVKKVESPKILQK